MMHREVLASYNPTLYWCIMTTAESLRHHAVRKGLQPTLPKQRCMISQIYISCTDVSYNYRKTPSIEIVIYKIIFTI